jgi:outer membrane autotransporter protein
MGRPVRVEFDTSAPYYGAHAGIGHVWNFSKTTSLDVYGKYLWTRLEGDSVTLTMNDPVEFDPVTSHRLQAGFRLSHAVHEKVKPYIGAAYDHEFDSEAKATTHGLSIDSHSLRGDTWMGEMGLQFKLSETRPVTLDVGMQGYAGVRQGLAASMQLKIEF